MTGVVGDSVADTGGAGMDVAAEPNCRTPTADGWITTPKPSSCVRNWISWPSTGPFLDGVGSRSHTPALEWQLIFLRQLEPSTHRGRSRGYLCFRLRF